MRSIFDTDDTDAVLLIDASNAFNSLNRAAALHNISVLCPSIATYAINTYRRHARLFVMGGKELLSAEGTTQGDPVAMSLYAVSLQPLIAQLQTSNFAKQCWFADDATGSGILENVMRWWNELSSSGPALGYFPNAKKRKRERFLERQQLTSQRRDINILAQLLDQDPTLKSM